MTIRTLVSRVRSQLKEVSSDSYLPNSLIWNIIYTANLKLIEQRKGLFNLDLFKTVDIETEEVNLLESSCVPLDCMGCRIAIPDGAEIKTGLLYRYIASPDLSIEYKLVSPKLFQRKKDKTKGKSKYAFYDNGYIYLSHCIPCIKISYMSTEGVSSSEDSCSILDNESGISDSYLHDLIGIAMNDLNYFIQKPIDQIDNKA